MMSFGGFEFGSKPDISQTAMDGRQKPFCGENKVDQPLGFCSGMLKTLRFFGSDSQNDEFGGF